MNLFQNLKSALGIGQSVSNIAATGETRAQKFLRNDSGLQVHPVPVGGPRKASKEKGPSYNEMLGIPEEPKPENSFLSYEAWKRDGDEKREKSEKRAKAKKQKRLDEFNFGLNPRISNDWHRYPREPITPQLCLSVAIDERLNPGLIIELAQEPQRLFEQLSEIIKKHGHSAAVKSEKNRLIEFRKSYVDGKPPGEFQSINYSRAEETAYNHRKAAKSALHRQTAKVYFPTERFVMGQLAPAFERRADSLEKLEREQHAATGGKFGLQYRPSQLLIALRQAPHHLAEMVKTPPPFYASPRAYLAQFGIILEKTK